MPGFSYDLEQPVITQWTRSTRCDNSGPNCPEVSAEGDTILVRDSERPGEVARFSRDGWASFLDGAKAGDFDQV
jgi:hypothetical protein